MSAKWDNEGFLKYLAKKMNDKVEKLQEKIDSCEVVKGFAKAVTCISGGASFASFLAMGQVAPRDPYEMINYTVQSASQNGVLPKLAMLFGGVAIIGGVVWYAANKMIGNLEDKADEIKEKYDEAINPDENKQMYESAVKNGAWILKVNEYANGSSQDGENFDAQSGQNADSSAINLSVDLSNQAKDLIKNYNEKLDDVSGDWQGLDGEGQ